MVQFLGRVTKALEQYILVLEQTDRMSEAVEMRVVAEMVQEKARSKKR